jgi:proteic killer suppression protein
MEGLDLAIKSFAHKGLRQFFYNGNESGLNTNHIFSIECALDAVNASHHPVDIKAIYGRKFSEKKGSGKGVYSIEINGNWRITFQIKDEGAVFLDYVDYHGKTIKSR